MPENKSRLKYFLGIDYGKSNIGLALADNETRMAFSYRTIKNDKRLIQNIIGIIENKKVDKIIIGIPFYANREKTGYEAERWGKLLEKILGIRVFYQNEMFTTKIAQRNLIEKGIKGVKNFDDKESARIILNEWLDSNPNL